MKKFDFGNGHAITIETGNCGIEDDYKIVHFVNGRKLLVEFGNADYIEYAYGIKI